MKAVVISEPGLMEMVEIAKPIPGPDEVLVCSHMVGINESDVELLQGKRAPELVRYPVIPGHAWSGAVVALGASVRGIHIGDRVAIDSFHSCGRCRNCRNGQTNLCETAYEQHGFTLAGGLAEYGVVASRQVYVLPATADYAEMAVLESAAIVAHAFLRAQPQPGSVIAIVGDGVSSLLAVQFAKLFTPSTLVLAGFREERLTLARTLGATHTINMSRDDSLEMIRTLTQGHGADFVFEGTGHAQATEEAIMLARAGGVIVMAGMQTSHTPLSIDNTLLVRKQLTLLGIFGAHEASWRYAVDLFVGGYLHLAPLISHRFPFADYEDAFDTLILRQGQSLKVLIDLT